MSVAVLPLLPISPPADVAVAAAYVDVTSTAPVAWDRVTAPELLPISPPPNNVVMVDDATLTAPAA